MSFFTVWTDWSGFGCETRTRWDLLRSHQTSPNWFCVDVGQFRVWTRVGVGVSFSLTVTPPQFDGFVVFQSSWSNDVFCRVTGGWDHHICRDTNTLKSWQQLLPLPADSWGVSDNVRAWSVSSREDPFRDKKNIGWGSRVIPVCPCSFWTISLVWRFQMYTMLSSEPDTIHWNPEVKG